MTKLNNKLKIIFVLIISLLTVRFVTPKLFIANTPRLNQIFIVKVFGLPQQITNLIRSGSINQNNQKIKNLNTDKTDKTDKTETNQIAAYKGETKGNQIKSPRPVTLPEDSVIFQIGKGAYAAEDKKTNKTYIMFKDNAQVKVYEYELPDGKKIILYEPVQ